MQAKKKSKIRLVRIHQIKNLLNNKNNQQREKAIYRMGKNIYTLLEQTSPEKTYKWPTDQYKKY